MAFNWDDLKVVLAISRSGSLTGAAQDLGIDQSTAGRRVSAVEADLGAVLFTRSKTGFAPTTAGETVIARALEMENRAGLLVEDVTTVDQGPSGVLRIVGNPWTLVQLARIGLPPLLAEFPQLDIRTISGPSSRSLSRGEAAIALWFETPPRETEFAVKLGDVPYALYAPADADAEQLDWVSLWSDDMAKREPVRWVQRARKSDERLRLTGTDSFLLQAAVRAGLGKGLLPMCIAEGHKDLVRVSSGKPDLVRALHLHAHPDTVQTARVQAVIACLRNRFDQIFVEAS